VTGQPTIVQSPQWRFGLVKNTPSGQISDGTSGYLGMLAKIHRWVKDCMQSKNIHYIDRLDHVRFLAAATVVLFHTFISVRSSSTAQDYFSIPLIQQGHTGVQLFMVISGMILTLIAGTKKLSFRNSI